MFAHVHSEGKGYFAHAGNWLELVNKDTNGNVSINGTINASELNVGSGTTLSSSNGLLINNNIKLYGNSRVIDFLADTVDVDYETGIRWYENNSTDPRIAIDYNASSLLGSSGQLEIKGYNIAESSYNLLAVINRHGEIGIGTNNPTAKLDVRGDTNITGNLSASGISTFTADKIYFKNPVASASILQIETGDKSVGGGNTIRSDQGLSLATNGSSFQLYLDNTPAITANGTGASQYVTLFARGSEKFKTIGSGVTVTGTTFSTAFSGDGSNLTGLTGVSAGIYGNANSTPVIVVDTNGRISQISTVNTAGTGSNSTNSFATKSAISTIAGAGQTIFNGTYTVGFVDVFLNGVKQSEDEYTATSGSNIILDVGASEGDLIEVIGFTPNISGGGISGINAFNSGNPVGLTTNLEFRNNLTATSIGNTVYVDANVSTSIMTIGVRSGTAVTFAIPSTNTIGIVGRSGIVQIPV